MSLPVATRNLVAASVTIDTLSLHTAWPGTTGLNEATGGSPAYARKAITMATASGGQCISAAGVTFDVAAGTYSWLAGWLGGVFRGAMPNGGATSKNFVATPSNDTIVATGHGYANGQKIAFFNGTPPGGLTEGTIYFVRDTATETFKVAATSGGVAIDLTSASSFGCVVAAIVEDVYASQGTHQVTQITVTEPD